TKTHHSCCAGRQPRSSPGQAQANAGLRRKRARSHGGRMADTRDLIIADSSAVPLPPPSLANGEDAATYAQLAARIRAAVAPANIIEEIWARDVADLTWDVVRLRRLKAGLFTIGAGRGTGPIPCGLGEPSVNRK